MELSKEQIRETIARRVAQELEDGDVVTSGGRVLMVVGSGSSLRQAHDTALKAVEKIRCENLFYRRDIGWRVL